MQQAARAALFGAALLTSLAAAAKPIAFQDGWTVMAEYGTDTMREAQVFYAPKYWWSGGASYTKILAQDGHFVREIPVLQANYLVHRWNLPAAQANVFVWGGLGAAKGFDGEGNFSGVGTGKLGGQADYETRSIYASLKTDWYHSSRFTNRIDTLQLGVAPYEHDYDELATWLVVQARRYTGGVMGGRTEWIPMVRLFKGNFWIEAGADRDGRAQVMVMMNF